MIFLAAPQPNNPSISIIRSNHHPKQCPKISRTNAKALLKNKGWRGKWSGREELRYIQFLELNKQTMESPTERVAQKIYAKMSKVVRSRNANQCRSHHQKLLNYHYNVQNILVYYKRVIFRRWQEMIRGNPSELERIAAIKRVCANQQLNYSLRVLGSTIRIEIDVDSVPAYSIQ